MTLKRKQDFIENHDYFSPSPTIVIGLSNVLTWSRCPSSKPDKKNEKSGNQSFISSDNMLSPANPDRCWSSFDYKQRASLPRFSGMKALEDRILSLNWMKGFIGYVICSGFLYGNGEDLFFPLFKQCFISDTAPCLPVYGPGKNTIPLIHAKDLGMIVSLTLNFLPKQKYFLAIDHARVSTQLAVMEGIAHAFGEGTTEQRKFEEVVFMDDFSQFMVDLVMAPCDIDSFVGMEEEKIQKLEIMKKNQTFEEWHCKKGLLENMAQICAEFRRFRGLAPLRVAINGPPSSGKTTISLK